jgi:putative (di)nucleoside polyphosphate hydrolase
MIDRDGFRANVGIILASDAGELFWARRVGQDAWQFPQGGIHPDENPRQAMFRELYEEVGLQPNHVEVLGATRGWLRYYLPKRYIRRHGQPRCIGQKQVWFLLQLTADDCQVRLDATTEPEFDHWRWVDPAIPPKQVIFFKRKVYRRALRELLPLLQRQPVVSHD